MKVAGSRHVYPLAITWSHRFAAPRAVLIGDAAVGMHPVTAHGFNLGLQSATTLARGIRSALRRGEDWAGSPVLREYESDHRRTSRPIYEATNLIVRLYGDTRPAARRFFHIDGPSMAVRALQALAARGEVDASVPQEAASRYRLSDVTAGASGNEGGDS